MGEQRPVCRLLLHVTIFLFATREYWTGLIMLVYILVRFSLNFLFDSDFRVVV